MSAFQWSKKGGKEKKAKEKKKKTELTTILRHRYTQITLMVIITTVGLTVWPASYAIGAEASSLQLRAKSQGLGWLLNCLSNGILGLVLPYIFNDDQGTLGAKTGFVYTGFCIVALGLAWLIVPEMKDKSVVEIDEMFEERRGWVRV